MQKKNIARELVDRGIITNKQLNEILHEQNEDVADPEVALVNTLIEKGLVSEDQIIETLDESNEPHIARALTDTLRLFGDKNLGGKYIPVRRLGSGGMGVVYKAYDPNLKRFVALKFLESVSEKAMKRFTREAETIARLNHPNIVPIYEVGSHEGKNYIAMQYVEGETLREISGELTIQECCEITFKVCDVLEHAHKNGIIHRDIKPSNIMVDRNRHVYVMDFGISKSTENDDEMTQTGGIVGTPMYMAPEQAKGIKIDHRCDIYSLGATLYSCITGSFPYFAKSSVELLTKVIEVDPDPPSRHNPRVSKDLDMIIMKSMYKDPAIRYGSVGDFRKDLEMYLQEEPVSARGPSFMYIIAKKLRKKWRYIAVSLVTLVAGFALSVPLLFKYKEYVKAEAAAGFKRTLNLATPYLERGNYLLDRFRSRSGGESGKELVNLAQMALDEFSRAIAIDGALAEAYMSRGEIYYYLNDAEKSLDNLDMAITHNPNLARAYYLIVLTVFEVRVVKHIVAMFNTNVFVDDGSGSILEDSLDRIHASLDKLISLNAMESVVKYCQGIARVVENMINGKSKWSEGSLHLINEAIRGDPAFSPAYRIRATIYREQAVMASNPHLKRSYIQRAIIDYERSIELDPVPFYSYIWIIGLYEMVGDYSKALGYLEKLRPIIILNSGIAPFCDLIEIRLWIRSGKFKKAKVVLKASYERYGDVNGLDDKNAAFFYITRADAGVSLRAYQNAMSDLDKASKHADEGLLSLISARKESIARLMEEHYDNQEDD